MNPKIVAGGQVPACWKNFVTLFNTGVVICYQTIILGAGEKPDAQEISAMHQKFAYDYAPPED